MRKFGSRNVYFELYYLNTSESDSTEVFSISCNIAIVC